MIAERHQYRGPRRSAGVAAVEFVISVPLLIVVLLVIAEIGRAFVQYDTLSYSVRNSARFVSENVIDGATGVVNITDTVAGQARNLAVYGETGSGGKPVLPGFSPGQVSVLNVGGDNIEVVATYPYQPLLGNLPLYGRSTLFTMRISVTMRAIS